MNRANVTHCTLKIDFPSQENSEGKNTSSQTYTPYSLLNARISRISLQIAVKGHWTRYTKKIRDPSPISLSQPH